MLEPHQLHQPDCDLAVVRWSRMVRSACRQLVLEPSTAYAVRVSAVFDDERAAMGAAEVVAGIVAEHALVADVSFGLAVSARIARAVLEDARRPSIASGPATTSQRDGPGSASRLDSERYSGGKSVADLAFIVVGLLSFGLFWLAARFLWEV